jgi:RNA polymerase sigma factor (sigma-70 family)
VSDVIDVDDETSTSGLLDRLSTGEESLFGRLFRRIVPSLCVWGFLRLPREIHHRLKPEDLVRETWHHALRELGTFDAQHGSFRAWVFAVANVTLATQLRKLHVRRRGTTMALPSHPLPDDVSATTARLCGTSEIQWLLQHAEELDDVSRQLLLFRGLEGLPHGEVGRRVGLSPDACEVRWGQLRQRLHDKRLPEDLLEH